MSNDYENDTPIIKQFKKNQQIKILCLQSKIILIFPVKIRRTPTSDIINITGKGSPDLNQNTKIETRIYKQYHKRMTRNVAVKNTQMNF